MKVADLIELLKKYPEDMDLAFGDGNLRFNRISTQGNLLRVELQNDKPSKPPIRQIRPRLSKGF